MSKTLTSIAVTPPTPTIPVGVQQQLKATAMYSNQTKKVLTSGITWSVSAPAVASVSSTGLVTALGAGVATVTVHDTASGIAGTATLTVTTATLMSLAVSPAKHQSDVGVTFAFKAIGTFSDGTKFRLTNGVTWSTTNPAIAAIDGAGMTTGVAAGTVAIAATVSGHTGNAVLTVGTATLVSVALTPATASLPIGATQAFVATGTYSDSTTMDLTGTATWTSSKPAFATITTPGVATGVAAGKTTITANVGGTKGTAVVTVKSVTLTSLAVTPAIVSLPNGTTQQFRATGMYSDHTTRDLTTSVTWTSSASAVTISNAPGSEGFATASSIGTATIGAIDPTTNLSATAAVSVSAASLQSIAVTPATASVALGSTQQYLAIGAYSDGSHVDLTTAVTWSASPVAVVAISNDVGTAGLATSLAIGSATVTASDPTSGISSTAQLAITSATLSSVTISPAVATIANGLTQQFTAAGTYSDHSIQDLTSSVTWSVPLGSATVSNVPGSAGLVSSGGVGTSTISAIDSASGLTATATLHVTTAALVSISVSPSALTLGIASTQQFVALGTFSDHTTNDLTDSVTWIPSNASVSVSNADGSRGLATGLAVGPATITAFDPATNITGIVNLTINACAGAGVRTVQGSAFVRSIVNGAVVGDPEYPDLTTYNPIYTVSDGLGGTITFGAAISSDGKLFCANVPAGSYYLSVQDPGFGPLCYVSNASALDLGSDQLARFNSTLASPGTSLVLDAGGLADWADGDQLWAYSPETGTTWADLELSHAIAVGESSLSGYTFYNAESDTNALLQGDTLAVAQLTSSQTVEHVSYLAESKVFTTSVTQTDADATEVTGSFDGVAHTASIAFPVSQYQDVLGFDGTNYLKVNPLAEPSGPYSVVVEPVVGTLDTGNVIPSLSFSVAADGNDTLASDMAFVTAGTDLSTLTTVISTGFVVPVTLPGASYPTFIPGDLYSIRSASSAPMTPVIGAFGGLTIGGNDGFQPQANVGYRPVIAWTPPVGSSQHYLLTLFRIFANGDQTRRQSVTWFSTDATSIQLPPGLLVANEQYLVRISAEYYGAEGLERNHPVPYGRTRVFSALFSP